MNPQILYRIFPFLSWWPMVNRSTLVDDMQAGLTGAVIVLPQGVAFALIAGLPPEYGLYTAMVTPIIAALWGSSFHLVSGPTTAISLVVFAALGKYAEPGSDRFIELAFTLTLVVGVIQLVLGLTRMGTLVNFVSHTVVVGFTAGAAILIAGSQLRHVLGVEVTRGENFFETQANLFSHIPETNFWVLAVAMVTLGSSLLIKKISPRLPAMFVAMIVGSLFSYLLGAHEHGVKLVGELPGHLPRPTAPDLNLNLIQKLAPDAFAIALLGLIEAVSIGRAIAAKSGQRINGNQEFIGQGLSNMVGSFFSCYAGSGSFTRSGVNYDAGAKTPISAIFAAFFLMIALLILAPLAAWLPIPAMGGIILLVAYRLVEWHQIREIIKTSKSETAILAVTFLATLLLDLEFAIYLGVILSLVFYLQKTSRPRIVTLAPDKTDPKRKFQNIALYKLETCPQLKVIRIDGSLFFGALEHVGQALAELRGQKEPHLLILGSGINFIDLAGAEWLVQEIERWREGGQDVYMAGLKKKSRDMLRKGGFWDRIGDDHIFKSKLEAVNAIYQKLDQSICATCQTRIFTECDSGGIAPEPIREKQPADLEK